MSSKSPVKVGDVWFGMKVIVDSGLRTKSNDKLWTCECLTCGSTSTLARGYDLKGGDYQSCGCIKHKLSSEKKTTHGKSTSDVYKIYYGMIDRCTNSNHDHYQNYGGRGITISERWLSSFENFYQDMGDRPSKKHSIDRIDNDLGYSSENCKWSTNQEQSFNRRKVKGCTSKYKNVYWSTRSSKWMARYLKRDGQRVYLGLFENEDDAGRAVSEFKE